MSRAAHAVLTSTVLCSEKEALEVTSGQEGSSGYVVSGETNCHSPTLALYFFVGQPGLQGPEFSSVFQGPLVISEGPEVGCVG